MGKSQHQLRLDIKLPLQGKRLGVAVSGGADSVALLHLLLELKPKIGFIPCVVHVNHMLRGRASDADEKFVASLAKRKNIEFLSKKIDVASIAKKQKANVEEVARRERYSFFEKLVRAKRVDLVAVAHTADDQAETVLAHILRGTGLGGLRGIHPQTGSVFRPLLRIRRSELRQYLKSLRQNWREDATNRDTRRTRSRIRHKLLPVLEKQFNPRVVEHLCQLAEFAREDEAYLEKQAELRVMALAKEESDGVSIPTHELLHIRREALAKLATEPDLLKIVEQNRAMAKRLVRQLVAAVKPRPGQLSATHVDAVLHLASGSESGKSIQLPGGVEVRRESELLRFKATRDGKRAMEKRKAPGYAYKIDLQGGKAELRLVELSCVLHFREIDWPAEGGETRETGAVLDLGRLRQPLVVRAWKPGDAMRPRGHQKAHSLARLLNEKSISRWDKQKWPVLVSGEKVAWTRGLAESVEFVAGPETRRAVLISEEPLL